MTATPGNSEKLNQLTAVGGIMLMTTEELKTLGHIVLSAGIGVYNTDTKTFKVSDGVTSVDALPNHQHDTSYAPLVHSHMFGTNQPWLPSEPRLWYTDDLVHHPELIPLNGQEIPEADAEELAYYYPGSTLLTEPVSTLTSEGYTNGVVTLQVDSSQGDYFGGKLFNDGLSTADFFRITDQWLSGDADLDKTHTVTITFNNGAFRPTEYWILPANGSDDGNPASTRPVPKSWTFEISEDGSKWTVIDEHTDEPAENWSTFQWRTFNLGTTASAKYMRLVITAWSGGDSPDMITGLRRFWVFGRKSGIFNVPKLEAPSDEFSWVVPIEAINTGLKHEDVGDIGYCALQVTSLPRYRLPTDGAAYAQSAYPLLYSVLGHGYDPEDTACTLTASDGTVEGTNWDSGIENIKYPEYVDIALSQPAMLSSLVFDFTDCDTPADLTIEGINEKGEYTTIAAYTNISRDDWSTNNFRILIDTNTEEHTYTAIRINFTLWNGNLATIGFKSVRVFTHEAEKFHVPTVVNDLVKPYIVALNTADDTSADVILALQQNITTLATSLASLQNQVNALDPNIKK